MAVAGRRLCEGRLLIGVLHQWASMGVGTSLLRGLGATVIFPSGISGRVLRRETATVSVFTLYVTLLIKAACDLFFLVVLCQRKRSLSGLGLMLFLSQILFF